MRGTPNSQIPNGAVAPYGAPDLLSGSETRGFRPWLPTVAASRLAITELEEFPKAFSHQPNHIPLKADCSQGTTPSLARRVSVAPRGGDERGTIHANFITSSGSLDIFRLCWESELRTARVTHVSLSTLLLFTCFAGEVPDGSQPVVTPKLVVLIVIDQFPAHIVPKLEKHLSPGGFRMFMDRGLWYREAYYTQAATLTGVGHATIATGGLPAQHGIPGNDWYDRARDREVYCVDDDAYEWVGGKSKAEDGTSPRNMTSTTFSDEWLIARDFRSSAIGLSIKDRGSILLVGRFGKAYWYDASTGFFVSSTYYHPDKALPGWLDKFNANRPADKYFHQTWKLLLEPKAYGAAADDRPYELPPKGLGRTFPHVVGEGLEKTGPEFYRSLATTPQGNELLLDLARTVIASERLGSHETTDILCISLTANDYCGHAFGCESLEYHDITLQTDRELESFFQHLDRVVGLDQTLIVLTSDHGASPAPEYLAEKGLAVGRLDPAEIARLADSALDERFGEGDWCAKVLNPGLFLRTEPMRQYKVAPEDAERVAAESIRHLPGIAAVFTRSELAAGRVASTRLGRFAADTFHAERSPDVVILQEPYWYFYKDMKKNAGMHGSPYPYDAHVPVMFYGPGIPARRVDRTVRVMDVAPTISAYLGVPAPSASEGRPLAEVLGASH
jgi:predicted AlkP superfamily pyrophosphatase or phosphodiesterase